MYRGFEVSSIHKLLKACNVGIPEGKLHIKWCSADSNGISIAVAAEPEMVKYLQERKFQLHCGSTVVTFREPRNRTSASRRLAKQARSSSSQAAKAKAKAAKGSATPKNAKPSVAAAGAGTSEPPGSGAKAQAAATSPLEAVLVDASEPSGSGASAQAASKSLPSPDPSPLLSSPSPGAAVAGSALPHRRAEPAGAAKGDPTSLPPLSLGEAGPSQDRPATPITQANQGCLAGCEASCGHQGTSQGDTVSEQAVSAGRGKSGDHSGSCSTRGK